MKKPQGYDEAPAYPGSFPQLPPGGYICKIKKAAMTTTKSGKEQMVLMIDVADGYHKGFFQQAFDRNTQSDKKWPNGGQYRQLTEGNSLPFFKGMITAIEESNAGFTFDFDEKKLAGKMVGCVVGREQYKKDNGELAFATKIMQIRSVEAIKAGVEPPEDKLLESQQTSSSAGFGFGTEVVFDDDDVPF